MLTIYEDKFTFECNECGKIIKAKKIGKSFESILNHFFDLGWSLARKEEKNGSKFYYFCPRCKTKGKKKIREIKIEEIKAKLKRLNRGK